MSKGFANLWAWLAADGYEGGFFFAAAAGGLAHLKAWLTADGHGDDVFLAAAGGLAHLKAWLATDGHENEGAATASIVSEGG
jgi:hypothetical protein